MTDRRWDRTSRPWAAGWWLAAASIPALAIVCAFVIDGHARPWLGLARLARLQLNADALVLQTAFMVIGAPLAGVVIASSRLRPLGLIDRREALRGLWSVTWTLGTSMTALAVASAVQSLTMTGTTGVLPLLAISRATLWAAGLALAAVGAFCASRAADPLDAAGCALALALLVAVGVLVAGEATAHAPTVVINAALLASPIVAIASAANVDILRSDLLYRLSPLAHIRFEYPAWQAAFGIYLAIAFSCFAAMALQVNRMGRITAGRTTP